MDANDLDRQLKQLELEKQTEELRQLRANSRCAPTRSRSPRVTSGVQLTAAEAEALRR
jgi:hypothetical protein